MIMSKIEKPMSKSWANAKRYSAHFYDTRFLICGQYLVYAVVGRKWVKVSQGDLVSSDKTIRSQMSRFRMTLKDWLKIRKESFDE